MTTDATLRAPPQQRRPGTRHGSDLNIIYAPVPLRMRLTVRAGSGAPSLRRQQAIARASFSPTAIAFSAGPRLFERLADENVTSFHLAHIGTPDPDDSFAELWAASRDADGGQLVEAGDDDDDVPELVAAEMQMV